MTTNSKIWICSKCHRTYPQSLMYCPKCNISKKHATRLMDNFLKSENKIDIIKSKNNRIVNNRKKIQERYKK